MNLTRTTLLATLALISTACGLGGREFQDALPPVESLTLELTGDASEGASEGIRADGPWASQSSAATSSTSEYLVHARDGVRMVNAVVRQGMATAKSLAEGSEGRPLERGGRVYGPKDVGNVTYRLFIHKLAENSHGWRLEAKPLGADDRRYLQVMGGRVDKRPAENAQRGSFGSNLNNMKLVDPSFPGTGMLLAGFGSRDGHKTLSYTLREFTPDTTEHAPVSAAFTGHRDAVTKATAISLALKKNLASIPNGSDAQELVRISARWVPGTGGRAGLLATGGDVAANEAYVGQSCWNAQLEEGYQILKHCTGIGTASRTCTTVKESGAIANCRSGVRDPGEPALDPMDGALADDAPETDIRPPNEQPTGEG